jgi:hypothetical protein
MLKMIPVAMEGYGSEYPGDVQEVAPFFPDEDKRSRNRIRVFV